MTLLFLIQDTNITRSKRRFLRLYLLRAIDLTLTSKIHQFPWNFLIETLSLLSLSLFLYVNFPKSNNICSWVLLCCKYYWIWVRIFQIFYIDSQSDLICTESILFRLYGLDPSIFSIYFISFLVPAQNQLFSLPLFFFCAFDFEHVRFVLFVFSHFAISEMYSEPSWMSGVGFLHKIVNDFKLLMTSILMFHWVINSPLSLL